MKRNIVRNILIVMIALCMSGCGVQSETVFLPTQEASDMEVSDTLESNSEEIGKDEKRTSQTDVSDSTLDEAGEKASTELCYVHVCGAVYYPGVYRLQSGARIYEAIAMAGGVTEEAYGDSVNQALPVSDGERIWIPTVTEWEQGMNGAASVEEANSDSVAAATYEDGLVNINTADIAVLITLPGIGETRAEAIVSYRTEHGAFEKIEDIQNVTGIKTGLYNKIKDKIKI